jgi:pyruvate,orthophosphate dikinase
MIPLVATKRELEILRGLVDRVAAQVFEERRAARSNSSSAP